MPIGYHYTTIAAWQQIQRSGFLCPYRIASQVEPVKRPDLCADFRRETIDGIWLWTRRHDGIAHVGSVLYQAFDKFSTTIVLLAVQYAKKDILPCPRRLRRGDTWSLVHWMPEPESRQAALGYWHQREPAVIVLTPIPCMRIRVVEEYDLLRRLA